MRNTAAGRPIWAVLVALGACVGARDAHAATISGNSVSGQPGAQVTVTFSLTGNGVTRSIGAVYNVPGELSILSSDTPSTPPFQCSLGGTAWTFSAETLADAFDLVVVDEAGQFSLANTIAVSTAGRNVLLLGDPLDGHFDVLDHPLPLGEPLAAVQPPPDAMSLLEAHDAVVDVAAPVAPRPPPAPARAARRSRSTPG